jgi:hypothetical protein
MCSSRIHPLVRSASGLCLTALFALPMTWSPPAEGATCYQDDRGRIVERRRPGYTEIECPEPESAEPAKPGEPAPSYRRQGRVREQEGEMARAPNPPSPVPRPTIEQYVEAVPMPDRWRIVDALPGYIYSKLDPYNRNTLKADKPVYGEDWFFNASIISDSIVEIREVPTPVGGQTTDDPNNIDIFGGADQTVLVQNVAMEFVYYKGDTVFRPPDYEFRFIPVIQVNHVELDEVMAVNVNPNKDEKRTDEHLGIQGLFIDKHLRNVSTRFDFDSVRFGIQPFSSDFRGFLFQDNQLGARLFGTRDNNIFQYNLAYFRRLEKDTNSGLNDLGKALREDDVVIANLYWQDMPVTGYTSQVTAAYNRNRESDEFHYNENGFIERPASLGLEKPRDYDIGYVGYNGDGHFGRYNLTTSFYYAFGQEENAVFFDEESDVNAFFFAAEASVDFDWIRPRLSFLFGSGDDDPFDDESNGFDAIFENPQFAGADTSYWIRQTVPLIGGGRVVLAGRNAVLPSLRSSKEEGQSNFTNPGLWLAGLGADLDVTPELRVSFNWNFLKFDDTSVLEVARNQGSIDESIGQDASISLTYRPMMSQNVVVRASYATLFPGDGFDDLFPNEDAGYFLLNVLLAY